MLQPSGESVSPNGESVSKFPDSRRAHRSMAGRAIVDFTLLGEIDTAYREERDFLRGRVIGQDDAIDAIINAFDRKEVRRDDDNRPIANLAFLGPTGVGKTETAKALSEMWADSAPNIVRIDCSNFSNGHEVASLIGSPPGYVGREQKPILSAERVEPDGTVVLFDEIEKGSPQLNNLLLQIMDNGVLELNDGTTVCFKNSVLIMTSNLGAREMARQSGSGRIGFGAQSVDTDRVSVETAALKAFKDFFSPEFVNRLDNLVVFHSLDENSLHAVLDVKLSSLNSAYVDKHGAFVALSDATKEHLVQQALGESANGARPLVRALEKNVATLFGRYVAGDRVPDGSEILVYHKSEISDIDDAYPHELVFGIRPNDAYKRPKQISTNPVFIPGPSGTTNVQVPPQN